MLNSNQLKRNQFEQVIQLFLISSKKDLLIENIKNSILRINSNLEVSFSRSTRLMSIYEKKNDVGCSKNILNLKTDIEN